MCVCIVRVDAYRRVCIRAYMRVCIGHISAKKDSMENVRKPCCPFARIFLSVLATSLMGRNLAMLQVSVCIRQDEIVQPTRHYRFSPASGNCKHAKRLQLCFIVHLSIMHRPIINYIIFHRHGKSKFSLKVFDSTFLEIKGIVCGFSLKAVDSILKTTKGIPLAVKLNFPWSGFFSSFWHERILFP